MIKHVVFTLASFSLLCLASQANAQSYYPPSGSPSTQDLREELERERYLTEIAAQRHERARLEREAQITSYENRMREVDYHRSEQSAEFQGHANQIDLINRGVNVLGSAIYNAQIASSGW